MVRRVMGMLALASFGIAFIASVFAQVPPGTRLLRALAALGIGVLVGWPGGILIERVILSRLAQDLAESEESKQEEAP